MYHALPAPCWGRAVSLMIDGCFHSFIVIMSLPLSFASCMSHSHVLAAILCLCFSLFCHSSPCLSCPRDLWGWGGLCLACCLLLLCLLDPEHTHVIMSSCLTVMCRVPTCPRFILVSAGNRLVPVGSWDWPVCHA